MKSKILVIVFLLSFVMQSFANTNVIGLYEKSSILVNVKNNSYEKNAAPSLAYDLGVAVGRAARAVFDSYANSFVACYCGIVKEDNFKYQLSKFDQ